jgi:hypothetical protein
MILGSDAYAYFHGRSASPTIRLVLLKSVAAGAGGHPAQPELVGLIQSW